MVFSCRLFAQLSHSGGGVQLSHNHGDLLKAGITESRIESTRVDLRNRIRAVRAGALAWGVFTVRKVRFTLAPCTISV